ncbi:MAG TPA: siroheme synthase CysG [Burkholderiales bacterium]|nr:siroheme synthase CysG [Burkholderiales bacterium]
MDFLPVFFNVKGRHVVIVGGGEVAARKTRLLLRAGAKVTVQAPELAQVLTDLIREGTVQHRPGRFDPAVLQDAALVIAATDDEEVNRQVHAAAVVRNLPVNVVDHPELCTFILPAIIDRSPVVIAVSSGGASPVLARLIRARLETLIPSGFGRLADLAARFRDEVKRRIKRPDRRRAFWEEVLDGRIAELVFSGQDAAAGKSLEQKLAAEGANAKAIGEVYLIGGGPGDPDLLTFRALRLMQQADVVVYDRLVSPEVLDLVRREALRIYAGKERDHHVLPQESINQLLVRLAREGKRVVRLKGGDPFIFGRGGEEIDTLMSEGIPFQVVPGITAAAGCAAYAGIPLTHRDYAQSVVFVTGHLRDGTVDLNWPALVQPQQTVVFYMGLQGIAIICRELIKHGMAQATPAALIQQGTTRQQRVLAATLATLPGIVEKSDVHAPTLIIVGDVVRLHEKLRWFEPTKSD